MTPRMSIRFMLPLAAALSIAAPATAQVPPPDSVIRAPAITVHAVRPLTTVGGASALVATVDSLNAGAAPTLEEVLRRMPLVTVRTNSRGEAQFSLRGSGADARQVAVLLDGVPLNLGWDDRADLSVLPATAATSVTLVRGLPSVLHGPNVLGGVVEVDVAQGAGAGVARASAEARTSVDDTGALALATLVAAPVRLDGGALSMRAGAGLRDRAGTALPRDVPSSAGDDGRRTNTDLSHADAFIAARYDGTGGAWLTLASSGFRARRGVAPELHTDAPRFWRYPHASRVVTAVTGGTGFRASPFGGRGDMEASVGIDMGRTEIVSYTDARFSDVAGTEDADDRTLTLRLLADQTVTSKGELRSAFTFADIHHDEVLDGAAANTYRQRLWSAALESVWRVSLGGALPGARVSIGAALDGADTPRSGDKPALDPLMQWGGRVGVSAASAGGAFLWHAGASRRARVPSLRELYSGALGRFAPNPELRPETLNAAEAGVTAHSASVEVQVVAFHRNLADAIEQVTLPDRRRQRVNVEGVRSNGAEVIASWSGRGLSATVDATVQRATITGSTLAPEYQPSATGGVSLAVPVLFDVRAGMDARYTSRQYCNDPDGAGQLALAPAGRLDAHAFRSFRVRSGGTLSQVELRLSADNVLDSPTYDQCGLPQPGRTLRLELRLH
jgi:iron complex outermembrane receptor protein